MKKVKLTRREQSSNSLTPLPEDKRDFSTDGSLSLKKLK
jgi:hypothetical protein